MLSPLEVGIIDDHEDAVETGDEWLAFDRCLLLDCHGFKISFDVHLLLFQEFDEVLGPHDIPGEFLKGRRTGHNRLHSLIGLLRQLLFVRLAGHEGLNEAYRLALEAVFRQGGGGRAVDGSSA